MRKQRGKEAYAPMEPKVCWHPYGLQMLRPEKFTTVVNSILKGDGRLLPVSRGARKPQGLYKPLFGD